jgi:hypothetical protein
VWFNKRRSGRIDWAGRCRDYRGEWFAKGHHFHTEDWTASELRVEIAGEGFDPASLASLA